HEPLERILDVLRGDLTAVDWRLVVELHALAKEERVDGAVLRGRPPLGEIGEDRKIGGRLLLGPVREAHELAVNQTHVRVRQEADGEMRIKSRRLALSDADDATPLGLLRE